MPVLEAYLFTLAGVALAQASPGPNLLAVAGAGLGHGRGAALATVAGVASGMLVWALLVAFGLGVTLAAFPVLLTAMKIAGGAYLLFLALKALRSAWRGAEVAIGASARQRSLSAAWRNGLLVVLTNPKAALMWSAVGSFLFGAGLDAWQVALFGPVGAVSGLLIYGTYALLFSSGFATRNYARFARLIEAGFGAAFGALGGSLLWSGLREART